MMGVQIPTREGAIFIYEVGGSGRRGHARAYTQSDSTGGSTGTVWMPTGGYTRWGAHWRNLVNKIESSMCGGDAALCQIT